jgi:hypothetical protein
MKPVLKIFSIAIIALSVILFSASLLLQDKVAEIVIKTLNKNISTKLDVGSFRLSFLRRFPKASLELKNVLVHSSFEFSPSTFGGINTDTLLYARNVSVEFKFTDIILSNYNIEAIGVRDGKINIFTDKSGQINYKISQKENNPGDEAFNINLERITINNISAYYNHQGTKLIIEGLLKNGKLKSRISGENIDFTTRTEMDLTGIQLKNTKISRTIASELYLTLRSSKDGIYFKEGTMAIDDYDFGLKGSVSSNDMLDLDITGNNINISKIRNYFPEKYYDLASDYDPSGVLNVNCKIKGILNNSTNPHIEINWRLNDGNIKSGKSKLIVKDLAFDGQFSNGSKNKNATSSVLINDFKANLGSSEYSGSLKLSRLDQPHTELILKGRVFPAEIKGFFDLKEISTAEGSVDMDLNIVTDFWPKDKITVNDIIDNKSDVKFIFNSFALGWQHDSILFSEVNGNMSVSDYVQTSNLRFLYLGQEIEVDGKFRNLPEWLAGRPVQLIANASISFNKLNPEVFEVRNSESDAVRKTAFNLPEDIIFDINLKINSFTYKSFSASDIAAKLAYKPRLLTIKSLDMSSLSGLISGNGYIAQNVNKSIIAKGIFDVNEIDVNKTFTTFNNFGQSFLKSENIKGSLSGSISLLLPMDSLLKPQIKTLTSEGKYILTKGSLIDFDPIKQLSSFIELSELENIIFDKLENDFFIRNNFLYIPQMDVRSSAADLSINGKHNFDNNYEYHVKILLSEILSKKRKKGKSSNTEFGAIEDDGLGRTSLLLKIEGKGEEVKVGYDMKAAGNEIKNDIKTERKTLKTILNQEYGWFKSDTSVNRKPAAKKSRFRISWDETDSSKTVPNPPVKKKKN